MGDPYMNNTRTEDPLACTTARKELKHREHVCEHHNMTSRYTTTKQVPLLA